MAACAQPDIETGNYTRFTDYQPQKTVPAGLIPGENSKVLVAWFSRVGKPVFDPDVDAVTAAALLYGSNGDLPGNARMVAGWIAEETGADVFPIRTARTCPSDDRQTVAVGEGQDNDCVDLRPASHLDDVSGYDAAFPVAPVRHYTVCTPLRAFLEETDFSGKTPLCVHDALRKPVCGSRGKDPGDAARGGCHQRGGRIGFPSK